MGAGRKKQALTLKEKMQPSWTGNCSASARNLSKNDLSGVIFGCKHSTFKECHSKKLFGLPTPHIAYVKKIRPGLPIFLFNYSDRKLHGIYEASSAGQLNIDPYGWTDGAEHTPYAAQVSVRISMRCQALPEDIFGPVIANNYYESRLFWFELDQTQTSNLIKLFSSSPLPNVASSPLQPRPTLNNMLNPTTRDDFSGKPTDHHHEESHVLPHRKWTTLFEASSSSHTIKKSETESLYNEQPNNFVSDANFQNLEWASSSVLSDRLDGESKSSGTSSSDHKEEKRSPPYETESLFETSSSSHTMKKAETESLYNEQLNNLVLDSNFQNLEWDSSSALSARLDGESESSGTSSSDHKEETSSPPSMADEVVVVHSEKECPTEMESVVAKLVQEMDGLKGSHLKQMLKIFSMEQELAQSKQEIEQLKIRCGMSESIDAVANGSLNGPRPCINEDILIVGGFDGSSWLSSLASYSPSNDTMKHLSYMTFTHATAAKLDAEVFVFGGVNGEVWYDKVESYNLNSNQWVCRPPLNQKKGSLAGVSFHDKIFAVGGGNGVECYSEVEMLDLNIGKWIYARSMQEKRFAPAAAEINGALFVTGGFDGKKYLKSVERFDPRENSWTTMRGMSTRRGCHSLVALNEKLYAIGGYDGSKFVSTVEIFEPRIGSWMMGESMRDNRGYSGAVVVGGKILVIGGVKEGGDVLDTIECYEGYGWEMTNLEGVGKRCFFSAVGW